MTLKANQQVLPHYSCEDWARSAMGAKRRAGKAGFWGYSNGDWQHWTGYRKINNKSPEFSPPEAADEMTDFMEILRGEIMRNAKEIDGQLMRLAKMEQELANVLKAAKEGSE